LTWYYFEIRKLVAGLPYSDAKITFVELCKLHCRMEQLYCVAAFCIFHLMLCRTLSVACGRFMEWL
jgi:hypothetical protein